MNVSKVEHTALTFVTAFLAQWAISGNALTKDAVISAVAAAAVAVWHGLPPVAQNLKNRL